MHDSLASVGPEARSLPAWSWLALVLLAAVVFAVGYDQGQLLRPVLGRSAVAGNVLHELFHDGRHLLGFPCH